MAIERITPGEIEGLADLAHEIDDEVDSERRRLLTEELYDRLYTAAHCPLTAAILLRLRANVGRYLLGLKAVPHHNSHSIHNVIVDAIRAQGPRPGRAVDRRASHEGLVRSPADRTGAAPGHRYLTADAHDCMQCAISSFCTLHPIRLGPDPARFVPSFV